MRQLFDRLIDPRLDRSQELIASSLGVVLGIAVGAVLACVAFTCTQPIHSVLGW